MNKYILVTGALIGIIYGTYTLTKAQAMNPCESSVAARQLRCTETRTLPLAMGFGRDLEDYPACTCQVRNRQVFFGPDERDIDWIWENHIWGWDYEEERETPRRNRRTCRGRNSS